MHVLILEKLIEKIEERYKITETRRDLGNHPVKIIDLYSILREMLEEAKKEDIDKQRTIHIP